MIDVRAAITQAHHEEWARVVAALIFSLARVIRRPIVASCTRNARAISGTVRPPTMRSVSAMRLSVASAG